MSLQTVQAAYAAFANNDPSVLFGAMAPDVRWNEAQGNPLADRNPYVGAQAIGEGVFGRLMAAIENFSVVPERFVDGGDEIVAVGRYGGTMRHSGATLDAPFCHLIRFKDGRIASFDQFTDSAHWTKVMP